MIRKLILTCIITVLAVLAGWLLWINGIFNAPSGAQPPVSPPQASAPDALHGKAVKLLSAEHTGYSITALADGRVLITDDDGLQVYDPASDRIIYPNDHVRTFSSPEYTALADGRLLALGGVDNDNKPRENRVIDVHTGSAVVVGAMAAPRKAYSATLLADGRVLIAGGETETEDGRSWNYVASAELFDPASGKFTATGSLATARASPVATLLADGRVLITGGTLVDDSGRVASTASAEVYDPAAGSFSAAGTMTSPRERHSATRLKNGRVLIVGGRVPSYTVEEGQLKGKERDDAELWDPASGTFSVTGALESTRGEHTATLLGDGAVLVTGGAVGTNMPMAQAWLYDPVAQGFSKLPDMDSAREGHSATLMPDGRVLIAGGSFDEGEGDFTLATCQFYDPKTRKFIAAPTLMAGRSGHIALLQPDGRVLISGGGGVGAEIGDERYDPARGSGPPPPWFPQGRAEHTAIRLNDGRVLLAGGYDPTYKVVAQALLFDPVTNKLSFTGGMKQSRKGAGATLLSDGRVLIVGGFSDGEHSAPLASAEVYDPKSGNFSPAGQLNAPRAEAVVVALPGGRALVVGGNSWEKSTASAHVGASAEIWNPVTSSFGDAGPLVAARDGADAVRLGNGMVLVAGGAESPKSAELYDPKSGRFMATGDLVVPRRGFFALTLQDGRVLIAGSEGGRLEVPGYQLERDGQNTAEVYDPASGGFTGGFSFENVGMIMYVAQLKDGWLLVRGDSGAGLFDPARLPRAAKAPQG